jgi:transcriptional regulator with XRE-family HTH domain
MDDLECFGKRLKELRTERELTLDMVVNALNTQYTIEINKGNLSKWENNVNSPSLRMASYLCQFYGVSLDYLLGLTDSRVPADLLAKSKRKKD